MNILTRRLPITLSITFTLCFSGCAHPVPNNRADHAEHATLTDPYRLRGAKNFLHDYPPTDQNGRLNVVVEIPTGTTAKWEVDKTTGDLIWEWKDGVPRIVHYLGYPGNYGMVPRTLLPREEGGDNDPVDVLILGPALPRGSVVQARPIGLLKMLDGGEEDHKVIAVLPDSELGSIASIEDLEQKFNGIIQILELWFSNYKGPGAVQSQGFTSAEEARKMIALAIEAYAK